MPKEETETSCERGFQTNTAEMYAPSSPKKVLRNDGITRVLDQIKTPTFHLMLGRSHVATMSYHMPDCSQELSVPPLAFVAPIWNT